MVTVSLQGEHPTLLGWILVHFSYISWEQVLAGFDLFFFFFSFDFQDIAHEFLNFKAL